MLKRNCLLLFLFIGAWHFANAQSSILDAGIRLQRDIGLYSENGVAVSYSDKKLMPDRLYFGFSYFTSRVGTAFNSNAIKQDNFLLSAAWYFRHKHMVRPFVRVNAGYFASDYPALFDVLPHSSLLFSTDAGLCFQTHIPLKISTSLGYNFIYGQGNNNVPGTLYPLYYQITLSWNILNHKK
jgi:hypothetical protein